MLKRKVPEQCFHVGLFIMLCTVVLTLYSVHEILECDHTNESQRSSALPMVLPFGAVYYAVHFRFCEQHPRV